jgi:hypothetical protein
MDSHAERVSLCSPLLEFKLVPDKKTGQQRLKLASAKFCRVRHCPICQWRRSLRWKAKAYENLPKVVADYPDGRWIFLSCISILMISSLLKTHIPYLATRTLINTNKSRLAEVLPHNGFRNHNLLINKSTPLYAAQKH